MYKTLLATCLTLSMTGCQLDQALIQPGPAPACSPLANKIDHWLTLESQYQQAEPEKKSLMLKQFTEIKDTATLALLLSQPDSNTAQLKKSIALFEDLKLTDEPNCDAEQYLAVRYQYTQSVMILQRALNNADAERKRLRKVRDKMSQQIEALTRIEKDLSTHNDGEEN